MLCQRNEGECAHNQGVAFPKLVDLDNDGEEEEADEMAGRPYYDEF